MTPYISGSTFRVKYPFVRCKYEVADGDVIAEIDSWKPGVIIDGDEFGDSYTVADADGEMILTVVDTFKPGRFPMRVFFTRKFINPDGQEFGKGKLHIVIASKFKRLIAGYGHDYELPA